MVFKDALQLLLKNDPLRMAGATAFFATFALPPILVILIQTLKLVLDPRTIREELFKGLGNIVGAEAVDQIARVLLSFRKLAHSWYIIIAGFVFLLFVATTLFKVIKGSINQLWHIRPQQKTGVIKGLRTRVQSLLVILVAGVLFVAGLISEGVRTFLGNFALEFSPLLSTFVNYIFNQIASVLMVTLWFVMVFRFLPDARPTWNIAFTGGLITALLFTVGKFVLHWLLNYSSINNLYGTSASLVLLLLFVFYSSLILYYGACFTRVWAAHKNKPITPLPYATAYRLVATSEQDTHA